MSEPRMVKCVKLGLEGEGLDRAPFKNELGQRLYESVSKEAWKGWISHSTMLINEYRVDLMSAPGREFLLKECEKYFFGEGSSAPKEFVAAPAAPDAPTTDTPEPKG
jgi:Fe-S cluster biosynthesis and repair protein YggX